MVGGEAAAVADDIPNPESSTDEDERNTLKGADAHDLPEKLGERLTGLYILLVSKILRRRKKGKNIHLQFQVKGLSSSG